MCASFTKDRHSFQGIRSLEAAKKPRGIFLLFLFFLSFLNLRPRLASLQPTPLRQHSYTVTSLCGRLTPTRPPYPAVAASTPASAAVFRHHSTRLPFPRGRITLTWLPVSAYAVSSSFRPSLVPQRPRRAPLPARIPPSADAYFCTGQQLYAVASLRRKAGERPEKRRTTRITARRLRSPCRRKEGPYTAPEGRLRRLKESR